MKVNCKNCNIEFEKRDSDIRRSHSHFCSRLCAAQMNNKLYPKRKNIHKNNICSCGSIKDVKSKTCHKCYISLKRFEQGNRTLQDITTKSGASRAKYNEVRYLARQAMAESAVPKSCSKCGFDAVVEVCHKKAIRDFEPTALVKEVNALDNLMYLCPNHHALFDRRIGVV